MNMQRSLFHDQTPTLDEVMSAWNSAPDAWASRTEIAAALGRAKSPTLIAVINVCVSLGFLTSKNDRLPNGMDYFKYQPTQKWWEVQFPYYADSKGE